MTDAEVSAKISCWIRRKEVVRLPRIANMPKIASRKFASYAEFNAWKESILRELLRNGGARWTR